jgi:hypothetical protein
MLRAEADRYWSYAGTADRCPSGGRAIDPATNSAAADPSGENTIYSSRDALAATLAPIGGTTTTRMQDATRTAEAAISRQTHLLRQQGRTGAARRLTAATGLPLVHEIIAAYRDGRHYTSCDQVAILTVTLRDLHVRDDAWARMDPRYQQAHQRMWIDVVRRACPGYVAPAASLLAFVAWRDGHGVLANLALDRALAFSDRWTRE